MGAEALFFMVSLVVGSGDFAGLGEGKPVMPKELAALKPGLSEEAFLKQLGGAPKECFGLGVQVGKWCVLPFFHQDGGYDRPALFLPSKHKARAALHKAWGPPAVHIKSWYWVNPETRLRARLLNATDTEDSAVQLDLETYVPMAEFLGEGPKLPVEKIPLLGATKAALQKAFAGRKQLTDGEAITIFFPPCEIGDELMLLTEMKEGKVSKAWFDLPTGQDPARIERVLALLEKKWGKRQLVEGEKKTWRFAGRGDVLAYHLINDVTVLLEK